MYEPETVWEFSMANRVKFGVGASEELPSAIREHDASSVLFIADRGIKEAGIINHLLGILSDHAIETHVHSAVKPEPSVAVYDESIQTAESVDPDLIIGVGGGSSMDVAKTTSVLMNSNGHVLDFAAPPAGSNRSIPVSGPPCICIPTTSGTGSETSPVAVISVLEKNLKSGLSDQHLLPDLALIDPRLIVSLPPAPTAFSGMDALGHAIEAFSAIRFDAKPRPSVPEERPNYNGRSILTDQLARKAIELIGQNLRRVVDNGNDLEARRNMALASLLAGMAFTNAGTTAAHALAMATGAEFNVPHGVAVAIFLPEVIQFNTPNAPDRFNEIARLLRGEETTQNASEAVANLNNNVGIPKGLNEFGVTEDRIPELAEKTLALERLMSKNARRAAQNDIEQILYRAL